MNADELKAAQAPLKEQYRTDPESAIQKMTAVGRIRPGVVCAVESDAGTIDAGLHPAAGGSGEWACSGDMLLQSLVACSGVTMGAVATALGIDLQEAIIRAEGEMDFCGTLGLSKEVPIGFTGISLQFEIQSDASDEQLATLLKLTERYCVIFQTLKTPPEISVSFERQ